MKSNSPYTLEHWLNKGYSKEEAEIEEEKTRRIEALKNELKQLEK